MLQFLSHLDILIWVTSPKKYADARFYELLESAAKAKENFLFVLNKADLLFQSQSGNPVMKTSIESSRDFGSTFINAGSRIPWSAPDFGPQPVSVEAPSPWNQFPSFRQHVFRHRDFKQVTAIKASNLDVQVQRLALNLEREAELMESFEQVIRDAAGELEAGRSEWIRSGREIIDTWLDERMAPEAFYGGTPLISPGGARPGPGRVRGRIC